MTKEKTKKFIVKKKDVVNSEEPIKYEIEQLKTPKKNVKEKKIKSIIKENTETGKISEIKQEPEYMVLSQTNKKIRYIVHIADIHISKTLEKHEEYRTQFEKLYSEVRLLSEQASTVILIAGDILDNNDTFTSEQVNLFKDFFYNLCNIDNVDVIACIGNHDTNMNNKNRIDSISVNLKHVKTKNPFYLLLHDKLYEYENLVIGLTSMFSTVVTQCNIKDKNKIKIGMYHGIVEGSQNDQEFTLSNSRSFKVKDFTQYYEYTCLGDIHKPQFLNKDKTVFYSGSLIQQSFGEQHQHGYMLIDLEKKEVNFNVIPNDYGYVKLTLDGDILNDKDIIIPKYPHIRLLYKNTTIEKVNELSLELKKKYNAQSFTIDKIKENNDNNIIITAGKNKDNYKLDDIKDIATTKKIIMEFIKNNNNNLEKEKQEILSKLLDTIIEDVGNSKKSRKNKYSEIKDFKLKSLTFSNFFVYGEENIINFIPLKGKITGIVGKIGYGKSYVVFEIN
jgi:DNA repair exonuclease SbcCD nuclease subunit